MELHKRSRSRSKSRSRTTSGEHKKRIKERSFSLPNDILIDILAKLPSRSLVRFLCISKSWQSFITHPSFRLNNSNFPSYFILQYQTRKRTKPNRAIRLNHLLLKPQISDNYANDNAKYDVDHHIMKPRQLKDDYQVCGSSNGLLLYASKYSQDLIDGTEPMYLWNPAIKYYKKVPNESGYECSTLASKRLSFKIRKIGFGYFGAKGFNDYKLLSIFFHKCSGTYCRGHVSVYSLVSDSWKSVPSANVPSDLAKSRDGWDDDLSDLSNHGTYAFVRGVYYWLLSHKEYSSSYSIVGFDMVNERFLDDDIRPPDLSRPVHNIEDKVYLFELNGGLALYKATDKLCTGDLWVLTNKSYNSDRNGEKETWTKLFTIKVDNIKELLMDKRLPYALQVMLQYDDDIRRRTWNSTGRRTTFHGTYVKSLALLGIPGAVSRSYSVA